MRWCARPGPFWIRNSDAKGLPNEAVLSPFETQKTPLFGEETAFAGQAFFVLTSRCVPGILRPD